MHTCTCIDTNRFKQCALVGDTVDHASTVWVEALQSVTGRPGGSWTMAQFTQHSVVAISSETETLTVFQLFCFCTGFNTPRVASREDGDFSRWVTIHPTPIAVHVNVHVVLYVHVHVT